jgi:selenocysteine lyase/cysteine desulfurase
VQHQLLENLRLVILDHIVLAPAVKEPIDELTHMIKDYAPHCFVLVDGAHAMGQVKTLNLSSMSNVGTSGCSAPEAGVLVGQSKL